MAMFIEWERRQPEPFGVSARVASILLRRDDLHRALAESARILADELGIALLRIWLFKGVALELVATAGKRIDDGHSFVVGGQFSAGHVACTGQPCCSSNLFSESRLHDKEWACRNGLNAFVGIPIALNGKIEGVLAAFDERPISPAAVAHLGTAAGNIALAILRSYVNGGTALVRAMLSDTDIGNQGGRLHALVVATNDGLVADWNRGAEMLFGIPRQEAIGSQIEGVLPVHPALSQDEWHHLASRDGTATDERLIQGPDDGSLVRVHLTISRLHGRDHEACGVSIIAHTLAETEI